MIRATDNDNISLLMADEQAERAFILSLLSSITATPDARELQGALLDDDFTSKPHRTAWQLVKAVLEDGQGVSPLTVYTQAKKQGVEFDITRYTNVGSAHTDTLNLGYTLHAIGQRRRLAERVHDIYATLMMDDDCTTEQAVAELAKAINDTTATSAEKIETFGDVYTTLVKVTQDKANGQAPQGTTSGFALIDKKGGLERGELMVVAGRNSNGKTSLALCMALNAAKQGVPVGIFSLEMTNLQLTTRLTSLLTGIDGVSIKCGNLTQEQWMTFVGVDSAAPIYFDKSRATDADTLIANIKGMAATRGVKVVVVDYLQLLRSRERERVQQIGSIAHRLEALSKQLEITIVLLSQLRRNQPSDPMPRLEELKESGDIADAADSIYMVYRPERHDAKLRYPDMSQNWSQYDTHGTALLICYKNRNGELMGEQLLGFDAATTRFYEKDEYNTADNELPTINDFYDL